MTTARQFGIAEMPDAKIYGKVKSSKSSAVVKMDEA